MSTEVAIERVPVVVTTQHRGVFFGYADPNEIKKKNLTLTGVRNCIRWGASVGGMWGLSATGPDSNCRVGAEAPKSFLRDVTSVSQCTEEAVAAWKAATTWRG